MEYCVLCSVYNYDNNVDDADEEDAKLMESIDQFAEKTNIRVFYSARQRTTVKQGSLKWIRRRDVSADGSRK